MGPHASRPIVSSPGFGRICAAGLCALSVLGCAHQGHADKPDAASSGADMTAPAASTQGSPAVALGDIAPGIHNLFAVSSGVFSGSGPDTDEAFNSLQSLGVRTVISVDGSIPEVAMAHAHGMRYVHIPVGYDGITPGQALELAKAVEVAEGPIYVHCHHGLHRGPAGAAVALVGLGRMTNEEAVEYLTAAGTSKSYPGLWACARETHEFSEAELAGAPSEYPEARHVSGLIDGMVAIDQTFDRIKAVREAGWAAPADHPDLAPAAEAGMLTDHFRVLLDDREARAEGDEFLGLMRRMIEQTTAFEGMLTASPFDSAGAERAYVAVSDTCNSCHTRWRN
ncbi:MAG: hypothetical protein IPJ41_04065 [Phycisphaerales bacterium]|nr:hypothetical protein [Phycisphaerales bacterium]